MIQAAFREAGYPVTDQRLAHFHADFEMLFITRGWCEVQTSTKNYRCEAPCALFFGNLETHRIVAASADYERYVLTLPPQTLRDLPAKLLSIFSSRPADFSHALPLRSGAETVCHLLAATENECQRADEHAQLCAGSLVRLLLAQLYRLSPDAFPAEKRAYPSGIVHAQRYLDEHFREPISIDEVARLFFMSPSYFRHLFQELIGVSPKQYIMLSRLAYARSLLDQTQLSIADIAESSGFADVSNFIRRFKAQYGSTPHRLRIADLRR